MAKPKFRHRIRPGNKGKDVRGTKRAFKRLGVPGSGAMSMSGRAGRAWEHVVKVFQRHHGLKETGIYDEHTHAKLVKTWRDGKPAFDAYAALLFRLGQITRSRKKKPHYKPGSAIAEAKKLIQLHNEGKFHDDRGTVLPQIRLAAEGKPVWSPAGHYVHLSAKMLGTLVWLIEEKGFRIGVFSMCSDHPYDGPHGHAGGGACDISSINGISVSTRSTLSRTNTLKVATFLRHDVPTSIGEPWQLICDGFGYEHDYAISACTLPSPAYYGWATMQAHRNHIHCGYYYAG